MQLRNLLIILLFIIQSFSLCGKDFTVILDAGHGGHDYGAVGSMSNEKTINLSVVKKLGKLISDNFEDVNVVYTRSSDVFIPLNDRAKIANKNKGDLFISVHVNSIDLKSKNRTSIAGAEVYTLGLHKSEENLAVAKRENSVMALESDFSETYKGFDPNSPESYIIFELSQSRHLNQSIDFAVNVEKEMVNTAGRVHKGVKQAGFWVLWATSMPAVLVELDFICNPTSERFLASDAGQDKLAKALYNAFCKYRNVKPENTSSKINKSQDKIANTSENVTDAVTENRNYNEGIDFRIQILAHNKLIPENSKEFKGEKNVESYIDGGLYKFTVGHFPTFEAAKSELSRLKQLFPQAFIIKMENGKRI